MPSRATRDWVVLVLLAITITATGCATKLYQPPTGPGQPFAEAATVWRDLTTRCRDANVFVAEVRMDGWVGAGADRQNIPATFHSALTRDDDIYLEVPAPGKSFVQMAGRAGQAVFLLPREDRVLRAPARDIVDRLIGLRWGARDLLNVLSGCVATPSGELSGTSYGMQASIELGGEARAYVQQRDGKWQLVAASRDGLLIEYQQYAGAFPSMVRVTSTASSVTPLKLTFAVSQHQVNIALGANTFTLEVPMKFQPMTLDELRSARPLKDGKDGGSSVSRKP